LHYSINSVMLSLNYRCIIVHYRKQLWSVFHYVVLSVLWEVTVGHIAYGRLHVREYVSPDAWDVIWIDFVVGLPKCKGFDAIWEVVDRLSKMEHLIPCHITLDALGWTKLFLWEVVCLRGLPLMIISDPGPQFASNICQQVCSRLGIDRRVSTAFHPKTDGQTEWMNVSME